MREASGDTGMTPLDLLWQASGKEALHVLDVGANPINGDAPYRGLLEAGYARVTGFEPQPEALAALNGRKSAAEIYFPHVLGDGNPGVLRVYANSGFTSLYDIRPEVARLLGYGKAVRQVESRPVETVRLDDLDDVAPADFLKIDVQGAELAIIGNGRGKLKDAVLIQTEVRFIGLYRDEPTFGDLERELRDQGFMFHDFDFLKRVPLAGSHAKGLRRTVYRQVIDGDAFFVRDLTGAAGMSETQLWRLALLAEAVVRSPSLVLFCLETLVARGRADGDLPGRYLGLSPAKWRR